MPRDEKKAVVPPPPPPQSITSRAKNEGGDTRKNNPNTISNPFSISGGAKNNS